MITLPEMGTSSSMSDDPLLHYYTPESANAALENIRPILIAMQEDHGRLAEARDDLQAYATTLRRYGIVLEAHWIESEMHDAIERIKFGIEAIASMSIELKDIEQGLIDFPAIRHGEIVYLCYRLGEPEIASWHTLDSGFAGRQPLDDGFES